VKHSRRPTGETVVMFKFKWMWCWHHHHHLRLAIDRLCNTRARDDACIISWRRSWDGGVQETSHVRHVVGVAHVPADCCGNSGPNQRIGCTVLKRSSPQNHFCLCRWQGGAIPLPTTLYRSAEIQRHLTAWVVWEWRRPGPLALQLF